MGEGGRREREVGVGGVGAEEVRWRVEPRESWEERREEEGGGQLRSSSRGRGRGTGGPGHKAQGSS
jgi:hypothetical protein